MRAATEIFLARARPTFVPLVRADKEAQILAAAVDGHVLPGGYALSEPAARGVIGAGGEGDQNAFGDVEAKTGDVLEFPEQSGSGGTLAPYVFSHQRRVVGVSPGKCVGTVVFDVI